MPADYARASSNPMSVPLLGDWSSWVRITISDLRCTCSLHISAIVGFTRW